MSSQVTLFDLPSKHGKAFSLNPWKVRLILNFKGVDYKTRWIEYPDLKPTFQSLGIPPNDPNAPQYFTAYSIPAIIYDDGTYGMDSWPIAHELEKRYPTPSLHLDDPIVVQVRDYIRVLMGPLLAFWLPAVPKLLNKASVDYFYETREKMFGKPIHEIEKTANEGCFEEAKAPAKELGDLLRKNGGPYFLGETVSYADFIFVSMLHFIKNLDEEYFFKKYMALDPAFPVVYEASKKWLQKDE